MPASPTRRCCFSRSRHSRSSSRAVYTESLFLALSVGAFYLARRQRFAWACVTAAAAALTHVEGVLLVAPLAYMYWRDRGRPLVLRRALVVARRRRWCCRRRRSPASSCICTHRVGAGSRPSPMPTSATTGARRLTTPVMLWQAIGRRDYGAPRRRCRASSRSRRASEPCSASVFRTPSTWACS